jgi:hypothetical protein
MISNFEPNRALARLRRAADGHQQGRLAGAVGADQGDDLALVHMQIDAAQRLDVAVERVDAGDFQHCRHAIYLRAPLAGMSSSASPR